MTHVSQRCSLVFFSPDETEARSTFPLAIPEISTLTQSRSCSLFLFFSSLFLSPSRCAWTLLFWQKRTRNAFGFGEMLREYHTGHIRMGDSNLTDAALGGRRDGTEAAQLKLNVCLWPRARLARFRNLRRGLIGSRDAQGLP